MNKIKKTLSNVASKLGLNNKLLNRAQNRYRASRKRAFKFHNRAIHAQKHADRLRASGEYNSSQAPYADQQAVRLHHKAKKNHDRAQFWLGKIKVFQQRINKLETTQAQLKAELKKLNNVSISGNKATGGTNSERLKAVALASAAECASGHRPNFYSQAGSWDISHCISGERYGERSDCSSWVTSVYHSCGLADPNNSSFSGGYTGTLVAAGREIRRAQLQPGDLIIYGSGTGHHVEMYVGPGDKTIGHGSSPVDAGVINLFGDEDYRFFTYN